MRHASDGSGLKDIPGCPYIAVMAENEGRMDQLLQEHSLIKAWDVYVRVRIGCNALKTKLQPIWDAGNCVPDLLHEW